MEKNEKLIERFETELRKVKRPGIEELIAFCRKYDMYTAPSSTKYHLSVKGGLLQHSLNVLDALRSILWRNGDGSYSYMCCGKEIAKISDESLILIALLHDICKTCFYEEVPKFKKDENGKWVSYSGYEVKDQVPYGHGEKSVMMIEKFIRLESVERYAIRWHMGFPDGAQEKNIFGTAVEMYPIIWAVHTADMMAAHFMEDTTGNREGF